ncbi:MAG: hypothetical protein KDA75_16475 [Planctomycetaceae bacterium]|nr:hypothetical protein [Planctomycetaceae bacterium]
MNVLNKWSERPQEISHLLNPAYCGLLLYRAVIGFRRETQHGMPLATIAIVPTFVLHAGTRARLPGSIITTLPTWIQTERDVLVRFAERTRNLVPFTREALLFVMQRDLLVVDPEGRIDVGKAKIRGFTGYQQLSSEIADTCKRAEFVGRWLAHSGSPTTIYALLGIRP